MLDLTDATQIGYLMNMVIPNSRIADWRIEKLQTSPVVHPEFVIRHHKHREISLRFSVNGVKQEIVILEFLNGVSYRGDNFDEYLTHIKDLTGMAEKLTNLTCHHTPRYDPDKPLRDQLEDLPEDCMDDLVHEEVSKMGSVVNNEGQAEQIDFLTNQRGLSEEDIFYSTRGMEKP